MRFCILMGSPRKNGNTAALLKPFTLELEKNSVAYDYIRLYEKQIKPCIACRSCQKDWTIFGCPLSDDVQELFDKIHAADMIVLATPIYSWYCTAPMKALLDRLVYGMNKFYGEEIGPSLWRGKLLSIVSTCGYNIKNGTDLFEEGIKRYCKHSKLQYVSMLAQRHFGYKTEFMDEQKASEAEQFAKLLVQAACAQKSKLKDCPE